MTLSFRVSQKSHSAGVLRDLIKFFGAGVVSKPSKRNQVVEYSVRKFDDIIFKIIPHFEAYSLVTSKQLNFESFKEVALMVKNGEHLTVEGMNRIKELKANMNTGRSFEDKFRCCWSRHPMDLKIDWVIGFLDGESSFYNRLSRRQKSGYEYIVTESSLKISQNIHDVAVLLSIQRFFGDAGYLYPKLDDYENWEALQERSNKVEYYNSKVTSFLPILDKYPLLTRKELDYLDFKRFLALKEAKAYKTEEGLKEMEKIILGMNSGRDGNSRRNST